MTGQFFQDGAIRAVVTLAAVGQVLQRIEHFSHRRHAALQVSHMPLGNSLHVGTGAAAVLPELQQFGNLGHAETQIARAAYEPQRVHFFVAVAPVTLSPPRLATGRLSPVISDSSTSLLPSTTWSLA